MTRRVTQVRLTPQAPVQPGTELLFGLPPDTPEQRVLKVEVSGAGDLRQINALNSPQAALAMVSVAGVSPSVEITFADEAVSFPEWIFQSTGGAHETPSAELMQLIADLAPFELAPAQRVERIVHHVEARFTYGVRDVGLGDDVEAMPALACDTHLGTCVDTHSYAVAAMRAAGFPAAYVSGLFFHEGHKNSEPGHCWFVVDAPGAPHHWDVSHFLKYGLGPVRPVFNPKPGVRFALSIGRDLVFQGRSGQESFARLSGFHRFGGDAPGQKLATLAEIL